MGKVKLGFSETILIEQLFFLKSYAPTPNFIDLFYEHPSFKLGYRKRLALNDLTLLQNSHSNTIQN